MPVNTRDLKMAKKIAEAVADHGGRTYYVGGFVRDKMLGRINKDIDIEVHGITPDDLKGILDGLGTVHIQGASFGVYNLKGYGIDVAQPRMEKTSGHGHKDFEVHVDPFIGVHKAAARRDFTMNAIMEDVLTGEVIDPFGGRSDIKRRVVRHVDNNTFIEDPLRVFRAAQFAARFDYEIDSNTKDLMHTMDVSYLSKERVWSEMEKAMLQSDHPSVFFNVLRETGQIHTWFPELEQMIGCKQSPEYHPEGDAWNHTMMVLDNAAAFRGMVSEPVYFMTAALCHDFGKPYVTSVGADGKIHSYGHAEAGIPAVQSFLNRLNHDSSLGSYVFDMTANHMRPHEAFNHRSRVKSTNHMFDSIANRNDIVLLCAADLMGKGDAFLQRAYEEREFLQTRLAVYEKRASEPMVSGRDLIAIGMKPSPEFSKLLDHARKLHFSGVDRPAVIKDIVASCHDNINRDHAADFISQISDDDTCDIQFG